MLPLLHNGGCYDQWLYITEGITVLFLNMFLFSYQGISKYVLCDGLNHADFSCLLSVGRMCHSHGALLVKANHPLFQWTV